MTDLPIKNKLTDDQEEALELLLKFNYCKEKAYWLVRLYPSQVIIDTAKKALPYRYKSNTTFFLQQAIRDNSRKREDVAKRTIEKISEDRNKQDIAEIAFYAFIGSIDYGRTYIISATGIRYTITGTRGYGLKDTQLLLTASIDDKPVEFPIPWDNTRRYAWHDRKCQAYQHIPPGWSINEKVDSEAEVFV
jgi:hypothetical protein